MRIKEILLTKLECLVGPNNFISLGAIMEYILDFWKPAK